ncbi:hypothetical protein Adt_23521 [Abeliophyllum distichum]|uniref:Uncharacterized protein n=1 Tax=Abeliophyllum distichum TaxID=126358 RepID=A0ABD1SBX9_9LAMI
MGCYGCPIDNGGGGHEVVEGVLLDSSDIGLMVPRPNERACFPRRRCVALHLHAFVDRVPAEEASEEEGKEKELGNWHRITNNLELDLDVSYVYVIANALPRCQLLSDVIEVFWSIYQASPLNRRYGFLLDRQCCLVKLGLMASKAEMDQGVRPRPTMARLASRKPNSLAPGSSEDSKQKKVIEELSWEGNKGEASSAGVIKIDEEAEASGGDLSLSRKRKAEASSQPKKKAVKASLAAAVRITGMQLKVLGEFRLQMQRHKKLFADTSKSEEYKQAMEGLQVTVESIRTTYEQLHVDFKESDTNVLHQTKKLDDANAAQKVTAEALEAANEEKK